MTRYTPASSQLFTLRLIAFTTWWRRTLTALTILASRLTAPFLVHVLARHE